MWVKLQDLNGDGTYGVTLEKSSLEDADILDDEGNLRVNELSVHQIYDPDEREFQIKLPSEDRIEELEEHERQISLGNAN